MLISNLASGQQPKETKRVLILIVGQKGVPGYVLSEGGMRAVLDHIRQGVPVHLVDLVAGEPVPAIAEQVEMDSGATSESPRILH